MDVVSEIPKENCKASMLISGSKVREYLLILRMKYISDWWNKIQVRATPGNFVRLRLQKN